MRRQGMTLIEVIVSIAILGIIAVGLLGAISTQALIMSRGKTITATSYTAHEQMENVMRDTREAVFAGTASGYTTLTNVFENNVSVRVLPVKATVDQITYVSLVSDTALPRFTEPLVSSVTVQNNYKGLVANHDYTTTDTRLNGQVVNDPSTLPDFMVNLYQWYVSEEGFNIPEADGAPSHEYGIYYPSFPTNYLPIPNEDELIFPDASMYPGRHFVLEAKAASKQGKIGPSIFSKPLFLNGFPFDYSRLLLHYDLSMTDLDATSDVDTSGSDIYLKRAFDQSLNNRHALPLISGQQAQILTMGVGQAFIGRSASFNGSNPLAFDLSGLYNQTVTLYMVTNALDTDILFYDGVNLLTDPGIDLGNGWKVVIADLTVKGSLGTVGDGAYQVAEFALLDPVLSSLEKTALADYASDKFKPYIPTGTVSQLLNMTQTINKGVLYLPPSAVEAKVVTGANLYVPVTWQGTYDVNTLGTYLLTGTYVNDTSKKMTLTLNVEESTNLTGVAVTPTSLLMAPGDTSGLSLMFTPTNAPDKSVTFTSSHPTIAQIDNNGLVKALGPGTALITVTTNDGGHTATCLVTVSPYSLPTGLILHLDAGLGITKNGSNVSVWADQSGQGNHFSQSTSNDRPTLVENAVKGMPVIRFNDSQGEYLSSGQQSLSGSSLFADGSQTFTWFIVSKMNDTGSNSTLLSQSGGWGSSATYTFGRASSGDFAHVLRGNNSSSNTSSGQDGMHVHTSRWDGTNHNYWLDTQMSTSHQAVGSKSFQNKDIALGASNVTGSSSKDYFDGDIAEVIAFNRNLTNTEVESVILYLKSKWLD